MPHVKIKQLEERVATQGVHLGGGPERRKLVPGEVINIPEDLRLSDGRILLDTLWETGKLELTRDPVTRPIDYQNYREGRLCAPNFKPRDMAEEKEMERVRAEVAARLANIESKVPKDSVSPTDDALDSKPTRAQRKRTAMREHQRKPPKQPVNKRARRRAAIQAASSGAKTIT